MDKKKEKKSSSATNSPRRKGRGKETGKWKSIASSAWMQDMRYGQSLSIDFFTKNAWLLIVLLIAVLSLIGLRYKTKTKMEEIKRLTHQLELAQSSKLQEKAAYMSLIRENEMQRLVKEKHLGLIFQEQPPYEVELIK